MSPTRLSAGPRISLETGKLRFVPTKPRRSGSTGKRQLHLEGAALAIERKCRFGRSRLLDELVLLARAVKISGTLPRPDSAGERGARKATGLGLLQSSQPLPPITRSPATVRDRDYHQPRLQHVDNAVRERSNEHAAHARWGALVQPRRSHQGTVIDAMERRLDFD